MVTINVTVVRVLFGVTMSMVVILTRRMSMRAIILKGLILLCWVTLSVCRGGVLSLSVLVALVRLLRRRFCAMMVSAVIVSVVVSSEVFGRMVNMFVSIVVVIRLTFRLMTGVRSTVCLVAWVLSCRGG